MNPRCSTRVHLWPFIVHLERIPGERRAPGESILNVQFWPPYAFEFFDKIFAVSGLGRLEARKSLSCISCSEYGATEGFKSLLSKLIEKPTLTKKFVDNWTLIKTILALLRYHLHISYVLFFPYPNGTPNYEKYILVTLVSLVLHMGHVSTEDAHLAQAITWPQGRNAVSKSLS